MYSVIVYSNGENMGEYFFMNYERILAAITDFNSSIYNNIEEDYSMDFSRPYIYAGSENEEGYACDFEFRYVDGDKKLTV